MPYPAIPILTSELSLLTSPVDIVKYILRHYVSIPKNINDTFNKQEISFIWDKSDVGDNPELMRTSVSTALSSVLRRYFPTATTINVDVTVEFIDTIRYNLVVDVLIIIDGIPYSISQAFATQPDGTLKYEFEG